MKYIECRKQTIEEVMREFKNGKLLSSSGKKVINEKQAIAIALNMAQKCSFNKKEANNMYLKTLKKLDEGKLNLSILNDVNQIADYFYLNKETGKRNYLVRKTLSNFLKVGKKGKVNNNMWNVMHDIIHT